MMFEQKRKKKAEQRSAFHQAIQSDSRKSRDSQLDYLAIAIPIQLLRPLLPSPCGCINICLSARRKNLCGHRQRAMTPRARNTVFDDEAQNFSAFFGYSAASSARTFLFALLYGRGNAVQTSQVGRADIAQQTS